IPQDGRITVKTDNKLIDIRVSTMPTISGEKIVCRLLDRNASIKSIGEIGIEAESLERLEKMIYTPDGLIIATGPTGCGKTTSLYSIMQRRLSPTLNFITIEDPVEYQLEQAAQVHIHQKAGLTFASSLRAALRQDPDVILVGEIRDSETAMAAFQAAMTGHLVFTTLHTNNTIATISRLFHLGIKPYLVASAVHGIFAQRLVRKICPNCKELRNCDTNNLELLGIDEKDFPDMLYYGKGCNKCSQTGYFGRIGLFEVFQMNEEFRHFLTSDYKETELLNMAKNLGMETLLEDGLRKVRAGKTTLDEILRVMGPGVKFDCVCDSCKRNIDINYSICPYCCARLKKFCKCCKSHLELDWIICPFCGEKYN
ncbi:MAG: GspE/PulE family protein, partial [candidate division Zixibacteria bacterium]